MNRWNLLATLAVMALSCAADASNQDPKPQPLRVFIRGGAKTHGPGEHDHPSFLKDWSALLAARGAVVDGAMQFPTAAQLEKSDVLVMFAAEAGTISPEDRVNLEAFT